MIIDSNFTKNVSFNHKIQKHIVDYLVQHETGRFSELRLPRTDTNLFSYHLKRLLKSGIIVKDEDAYTLGPEGLAYIAQQSAQPRVATMLLVQNSEGDVLLQRIEAQPYINTWTLPLAELPMEAGVIADAAQLQVEEQLGIGQLTPAHVGDCYIRVSSEGRPISTTLVHLFKCDSDEVVTSDSLIWARPHKLAQYRLGPATAEIMTRGFFNDPFFFEEYAVEWV